MSSKITFITGNASKAKQLAKYLKTPVIHQKIDLIEIQSLDLSEVVKHKVMEAYSHIKAPVIVDDVSLTIHSLGNLPGPFIKYFTLELGFGGISKLASKFKNRSATAAVAIGYCDGNNLEIFEGKVEGQISKKPTGKDGFGWDVIFIPKGYKQTRASMSEENYDKTSARRIALEKLDNFLKSIKK